MKQFWGILLLGICGLIGQTSQSENKYTKEANINYREVKDPFRMAKINSVWHKALHKLTDTKLKSLYTDLMAQDKDEMKLKRLKSDGHDKEGMQEAFVRRKFKEILTTYGLLEHFIDGTVPQKSNKKLNTDENFENQVHKNYFKDKKLAKLWDKAERSGFDQKELKLLKEEFQHHQDKIDEYYSVLEAGDKESDRPANFLEPLTEEEAEDHFHKSHLPSKKYPDGGLPNVNEVRTRHRDIKDGYDVLHKKVASGKDSKEFSEPRVANLWKIALNADFKPDELESLREELKHYEKRVEKLQHLQSDYLVKKVNSGREHLHTDKDTDSLYTDKIKRHERSVEKLHLEMETRILNRHNEL